MPEYLHPGVYIEEIERGPKPIEGVPTSTAAFIGETERGPTKPRLVTSCKDYQRWFGDVFGDAKFMPYAVSGFFENGGKRMYVCRVTDDAATPAEAAFGPFQIKAVGPGLWGKRLYVNVDDSTTLKPVGNKMVPVGSAGPRGVLRLASQRQSGRLVRQPDEAAVSDGVRDVRRSRCRRGFAQPLVQAAL
ncbi:MAG: hypothetical protein U1E63_15845 [Burkholderiales bacterium]